MEAHDLGGVVVEGVVGVRKNLRGVVVGHTDFADGVLRVRGDVEGSVLAADRVHENRAESFLSTFVLSLLRGTV